MSKYRVLEVLLVLLHISCADEKVSETTNENVSETANENVSEQADVIDVEAETVSVAKDKVTKIDLAQISIVEPETENDNVSSSTGNVTETNGDDLATNTTSGPKSNFTLPPFEEYVPITDEEDFMKHPGRMAEPYDTRPITKSEELKPCYCSCLHNYVHCRNSRARNCTIKCFELCKNATHNLDQNGNCPSEGNCTCVMEEKPHAFDPVCAYSTFLLRGRTFINARFLHCYNTCHDNEYLFKYEGNCTHDDEYPRLGYME